MNKSLSYYAFPAFVGGVLDSSPRFSLLALYHHDCPKLRCVLRSSRFKLQIFKMSSYRALRGVNRQLFETQTILYRFALAASLR